MDKDVFSPLCIVGVDEAGRGAWAGPVVAAALSLFPRIEGVYDSKLLTPKKREELFSLLADHCPYAIGEASANEIDMLGIKKATQLAMQRAIDGMENVLLEQHPLLLVDGNDKFSFTHSHQSFVRGDSRIPSIGAASIIAKVHRDRLMVQLDDIYSGYSFRKHKGYGTALYQEALEKYGPCEVHRRTYAPIKKFL